MNKADYIPYICAETLMGPSCVRLLEELLAQSSRPYAPHDRILDLGCGKGLTSLVLARETGAQIYANDLWISAEENAQRFEEWGVGKQITPVHEDATRLGFEPGQFQALFSIDSYHYFAGEPGFFEQKILPFLSDGAEVLIAVPGTKAEYSGRSEELLSDWLGDEAYMFKSTLQWKELLGFGGRIESVETWEMDCFQEAWDDWLATKHEFALGDQKFFESLIKPYTCFVGMKIKIR